MGKKFLYYSSLGATFSPIDLSPDLIFDPNFQWFSDLGITPVVNNDTVAQVNNLGVGVSTKGTEATNKITWKQGDGTTLGGLPYGLNNNGSTVAYALDSTTALTSEFETFIVIETISNTSLSKFQTVFCTENNNGRGYIRFDYGLDRLLCSVGAGAAIATQSFSDNTKYILNISRNSSNLVTLRVNNSIIGTGTHTPAPSVAHLLGRSDEDYKFYYSFFKSAELSSGDRTQLYNYLNNLYA